MANEETLATSCFYRIRQLILGGEFRPGDRLKGEYLKQILKVGSSPIREALTKLAASEIVEFKDKAGFSVTTISEAKVHDAFKTFAKVECMLFKESMLIGDDCWEANVMAALYKLAKVEVNGSDVSYRLWSDRNDSFHDALISACDLPGLFKIRNECSFMKEWYTKLCYKGIEDDPIATNHHEHAKIAELAIARKVDMACSKLYNHIIYDLDSIVVALKRKGYINDL